MSISGDTCSALGTVSPPGLRSGGGGGCEGGSVAGPSAQANAPQHAPTAAASAAGGTSLALFLLRA